MTFLYKKYGSVYLDYLEILINSGIDIQTAVYKCFNDLEGGVCDNNI